MSLPAISKHLKVLERAGLIPRGREAQWRPCRIELTALKGVDDWLEEYRRLWDERFDRLDVYLQGTASQGEEDVAARSSLDLEQDPRIIDRRRACSTRRASWCGRRGPIPSIWRNGGARTALRTTTSAYDLRPGGVWRFVMHGPDGRDYQNRITFDEIVKPERLVYHHGGGDDVEPVQFRTTVTFEELGGKTTLTMRARVPVGRRARARDQGIRRRQGRGADACRGSASTLPAQAPNHPGFFNRNSETCLKGSMPCQ